MTVRFCREKAVGESRHPAANFAVELVVMGAWWALVLVVLVVVAPNSVLVGLKQKPRSDLCFVFQPDRIL